MLSLNLFICLAQEPPLPPYHREQTVAVYASSYEPGFFVEGTTFYSANGSECVAFKLPTLKRAWKIEIPGEEQGESVLSHRGILYVTTSPAHRKSTAHLLALDSATGKSLWSLPRTGGASQMAVTGNTLYVSMKTGTMSAIDLKSRRTMWTTALSITSEKGMEDTEKVEAVSTGTGFVALNFGSTTFCLDAKTGKKRWQETKAYMFHGSLPVTDKAVWSPSNDGSVLRNPVTGKEIWRDKSLGLGEFGGVIGGNFVGLNRGQFFCIDGTTGKTRWSIPTGDSNMSGGSQYGSVLGKTIFALGQNKGLICRADGTLIWTGKPEETLPRPCWSDGQVIVCFDGTRLIRYRHGQEMTIPTDPAGRKALASKMVARFEELDRSDIVRLKGLGDAAFEPLLAAVVKAFAAYDALGEKGDSYPMYSKAHDLGDVLPSVTTASRTADLIAAIEQQKGKASAKPLLLSLLAKVGDPKVVTPYFLKEVEGTRTPGFELYESNTFVARSYLLGSKDPRAVAWLIKSLNDPKADEEVRFQAYVHLAGTGGEEGLKTVLAHRNKRELLRPMSDRVIEGFLNAGEFGKKMKPVAEKTLADGRTFGLLESGVLGSSGDLWIAQKVDGAWKDAVFTGVSTSGVSKWAEPAPPEPKFNGKTADQLATGAWVAFVDDPGLRKDTDSDGLTDIEEKRLGSDPAKADTDGDGDLDGVDPWPNAAPRVLSEAEQVLAAVFEARYHYAEGEGAALFFAPVGMEPFEMVGRKGPVMWVKNKGARDWSLPLEQCYDQGVGFISFGGREGSKPWEEQLIRWNADKSQANVEISIYYGGLNGTGYEAIVRKFGDTWVVTSMRMAYVS